MSFFTEHLGIIKNIEKDKNKIYNYNFVYERIKYITKTLFSEISIITPEKIMDTYKSVINNTNIQLTPKAINHAIPAIMFEYIFNYDNIKSVKDLEDAINIIQRIFLFFLYDVEQYRAFNEEYREEYIYSESRKVSIGVDKVTQKYIIKYIISVEEFIKNNNIKNNELLEYIVKYKSLFSKSGISRTTTFKQKDKYKFVSDIYYFLWKFIFLYDEKAYLDFIKKLESSVEEMPPIPDMSDISEKEDSFSNLYMLSYIDEILLETQKLHQVIYKYALMYYSFTYDKYDPDVIQKFNTLIVSDLNKNAIKKFITDGD